MAFFGLTTLGTSEPIRDLTASPHEYVFHTIDEARYHQCFDKYLLGNSPTALLLEVDGSENILRASLGDMLRELLGRPPRKHELDAWFTYCDFDRHAIMHRDEFVKAVGGLIEFSAHPKKPSSYASYDEYRKDWLRHTRVEYERQHACRAAMTTSQEVGWHNIKPAPHGVHHHLNSTDVTLREGWSVYTYFSMH